LWACVRNHQLGIQIRRQHALLGRFIADFYCAQARLCIEVDGDIHAEPDQEEYGAARTSLLQAAGYRVKRFTNRELLGNLPAVLEAIRDACVPAERGEDPR
jgi:very-short-patch-repair endonuclease